MTTFPFEVPRDRLEGDLDAFVDAIFSTLESEFLVLARGNGFVAYPAFELAYQALKQGSDGFRDLNTQRILDVVLETPLALVVLRTMLGFTPSEWAYLASRGSGITVTQGYARQLDRRVRVDAVRPLPRGNDRITALVRSACDLLSNGPPASSPIAFIALTKRTRAMVSSRFVTWPRWEHPMRCCSTNGCSADRSQAIGTPYRN